MRPEFPPEPDPDEIPPEEQHMGATRLARRVFVAFIVTFALARSTVILMSIGRLHDYFLRFGQTHIHHLNYGIFILSGVGAYLIFVRPDSRGLARAAILYGVGLALTFDEFGMWLHLDDIYWQRGSFDAMVLITAILGLLIAAPAIRRFHLRHWVWTLVLTVVVGWFCSLMIGPYHRVHDRLAPWFQNQNRRGAAPAAPPESTLAQPPAGPSQRIKK